MCLYLQNTIMLVSEDIGKLFLYFWLVKKVQENEQITDLRVLLHFTKCPNFSGNGVVVHVNGMQIYS